MNDTKERINKMLKKSEAILQAGKPNHSDIKVPPFTDGQKKVIEATEKLANGKLICDVDVELDELYPTEQTNEEWFNSLPITEKSEFMVKMITEAIEVHEKHGISWHESVSWWDGWLKEVHKE